MIDIHNHSLAGIDDGAINMAMSLTMLDIAHQDGITDIVLTPHHLNGVFTNSATQIRTAYNQLIEELKKGQNPIKLHLGSEIHLTHETLEQILSNQAMTYCDLGKMVLIELPKHSIPNNSDLLFKQLIDNNIVPIIAHPERNSAIRNNLNILQTFISIGCKSQLTAMSCTGEFGSELKMISNQMIKKGLAHFIASDAHRPDSRAPILSRAKTYIAKLYGENHAQTLFIDNPKSILLGDNVKDLATNQPTKKKKIFSFLR